MQNKRILVVDDEPAVCDSLKSFFIKNKFDVDVAFDGLSAKNLLDYNKYNFIFFDCNMPELSGVELAKIIIQKNPEAKRIMISGYDLINEDFVKSIGVDIFLDKPLSFKKIASILNNT